MINYIVAANITAALFMLVLIIAMKITGKKRTKETKAFILCLFICFIGCIFNALSYILNGNVVSDFLVALVNYFAFIFIDLLIAAYALYFYYMVNERVEKFSKVFLIYIFSLCLADFTFLTIGTLTKNLYTIENGVYTGGAWWDFCPIIPAICLSTVFIVLIIYFKKLGKVYSIALMSYLLLAIMCAVLQLINVNLEFGYVGAAISLLIMYIMLQSRLVYDTNVRAEIYNELSTLDVLTGLKNRRGYEKIISSLDESIIVAGIFCDLNNLKLVNDTLGHESGDQYIKKFADMMRLSFPNDHICRISGDEFVIIIENIDKDIIEKKINDFRKEISLNNDIASLGYSFGEGKDIINIIKDAEQLMYDDKEKYYKKTGKTRRL